MRRVRVVSLFAAVAPDVAPSYDPTPCQDCRKPARDGGRCRACQRFIDSCATALGRDYERIDRANERAAKKAAKA